MLRHATRMTVRSAVMGFALAALAISPSPSEAETAWVKDELRLNLRTGPGTEFRITGIVASGDQVSVVERREGWTLVQVGTNEPGWIPVGYLLSTPPTIVQLGQAEEQVTSLQEKLDQITAEVEQLRATNQSLDAHDGELTAAMERLARENQGYRAAAKWGGYITGAAILATGMIVGWILKASSGRNRATRIRL